MDTRFKHVGEVIDIVIEECSELVKELCKVRRFGWYSYWPPSEPDQTNLHAVANELSDLFGALGRLELLVSYVEGHPDEFPRKHVEVFLNQMGKGD